MWGCLNLPPTHTHHNIFQCVYFTLDLHHTSLNFLIPKAQFTYIPVVNPPTPNSYMVVFLASVVLGRQALSWQADRNWHGSEIHRPQNQCHSLSQVQRFLRLMCCHVPPPTHTHTYIHSNIQQYSRWPNTVIPHTHSQHHTQIVRDHSL